MFDWLIAVFILAIGAGVAHEAIGVIKRRLDLEERLEKKEKLRTPVGIPVKANDAHKLADDSYALLRTLTDEDRAAIYKYAMKISDDIVRKVNESIAKNATALECRADKWELKAEEMLRGKK